MITPLKHYYPNEQRNAHKVYSSLLSHKTVVAHLEQQAGKTSLVTTVPVLFASHVTSNSSEGKVLYTLQVADNNLFEENSEKIRKLNHTIKCKKLHWLLQGDNLLRLGPIHTIFFDESHAGMGCDSKLKLFLLKVHQANPQCRFVFLGATGFQFISAHLDGSLRNDSPIAKVIGPLDIVELEAGAEYYGSRQMLADPNCKIEHLEAPFPYLVSDGLLGVKLSARFKAYIDHLLSASTGAGWFRKSCSIAELQAICDQINLEYPHVPNFARAIFSGTEDSIRQQVQDVIFDSYSQQVIGGVCGGITAGFNKGSDAKSLTRFAIEDRNVTASELQGLVGREFGYNIDPHRKLWVACKKGSLSLMAAFSENYRILNETQVQEFNQDDKHLSTWLKVKATHLNEESILDYFILPLDLADGTDVDIKTFVLSKFAKLLERALNPHEIEFERYWHSHANPIQRLLIERGKKGGDNRITPFWREGCESPFPDAEKLMFSTLEDCGHPFTASIIQELGVTHRQVLAAVNEGRLYRLKVQVPCDRTDLKFQNKSLLNPVAAL